MRQKYNNVFLGFLLGLVVPFIAIFFFQVSNYKRLTFSEFFTYFYMINFLSKLVSLCVLPNLLVFFIFIWKNLLYSARGVLFATVIWSVVVVLLKFVI